MFLQNLFNRISQIWTGRMNGMNMRGSRLEHVSKNFIWEAANSVVVTIFPFLISTLLIHNIGVKYGGVSFLFSGMFLRICAAVLVPACLFLACYRDNAQLRLFFGMLSSFLKKWKKKQKKV